MAEKVHFVLPDELAASVKPMLQENQMEIDEYVLAAVTWYTNHLRQMPNLSRAASWADSSVKEQTQLLKQVHEQLAPYSAQVLDAALDDEPEDWEALLA